MEALPVVHPGPGDRALEVEVDRAAAELHVGDRDREAVRLAVVEVAAAGPLIPAEAAAAAGVAAVGTTEDGVDAGVWLDSVTLG